MKSLLFCLVVLLLSTSIALTIPSRAQAIIILPPLLLVPIITLLGGMTAVLSLPATLFSAFLTSMSKPKKKQQFFFRTVFTSVLVLSLVAIGLFIFLRLQNPDRPLW